MFKFFLKLLLLSVGKELGEALGCAVCGTRRARTLRRICTGRAYGRKRMTKNFVAAIVLIHVLGADDVVIFRRVVLGKRDLALMFVVFFVLALLTSLLVVSIAASAQQSLVLAALLQ